MAVPDLRGGARNAYPLGSHSFDFMQFLENLAKSYVGAPHLGEILDPPLDGSVNWPLISRRNYP